MMETLSNYLGEYGIKILLLGLMVLVSYFLMLRPKQAAAKRKEKFMEDLKKGMEIVTIGGIHGSVVSAGETTVVIEIDKKGSQITIAKQAISIPGL